MKNDTPKNYGYANGWSAETAAEVQEIENRCHKEGHKKSVSTVDRCVKEYKCETCGYVYYVDSSD